MQEWQQDIMYQKQKVPVSQREKFQPNENQSQTSSCFQLDSCSLFFKNFAKYNL